MEKERKREGEGRGGEMRRGIVIGGMVLSLLIGCNNGGEDPQKVFLKSVVSLGNDFLNIFTSFGEMAGSALGFKTAPKKSDVANYFNKVKDTVQGTKEKLEKIVADMEKEGNPNVSAVKTKVDELIKDKLTKIIDGAKTVSGAIGTDAQDLIGNVATASDKKGVAGTAVDKLVDGIKGIVNVVLGPNEGKHDAGDEKGPVNESNGNAGDARSSSGSTHGDARKLFASDSAGAANTDAAKAVKDAAKAVSSVTGADILQAMAQVGGKAFQLANSTSAHSAIVNVATNAKDAEVAGGIALRAMAKSGKFASATSAPAETNKTIELAAVSAVAKALDTLTIAIRKTIDEGLKEVKGAMKINANDTPVTTEAKNQ